MPVLIAVLIAGCGKGPVGDETGQVPVGPDMSDNLLLPEIPGDVTSLVSALETATPGNAVVVTGRVGGTLKPLSEDFAGFVLTDEIVYFCDEGDTVHCATPWDACCEDPDKLAASRAFVQFVDPDGNPLPLSLRTAAALSENDTVVVKGVLSPESTADSPIIIADGLAIVN